MRRWLLLTNNKKMFVFTLGGRKKSRFQVRRGTDQSLKAFRNLKHSIFWESGIVGAGLWRDRSRVRL